ncbi:MAG: class I SAM-dependent methyltransferase [Pyrinomonadaceae bacterium]
MPLSFRDPSGCLAHIDGRLIRVLSAAGAEGLRAFLASPSARRLTDAGSLVTTRLLDADEAGRLIRRSDAARLFTEGEPLLAAEHERVTFQSFPYEWPPEMLHAAAALTLDVAEAALADGFGLKDATPFNVLFRGARPVFIDLTSFERRDPHDPTWLPYAQFVRTFLLPLLAARHFRLRLDQIFTTRREGLEPEEVYRLCSRAQRLRAPFLTHVSAPVWLARRDRPEKTGAYRARRLSDPARARFVLEQLFKRLRRALARAAPSHARASVWSGYTAGERNFNERYFASKQSFVAAALREHRPQRVLDVGCNTGHFSRLAAEAGASVVAIDTDEAVVGAAWREAAARSLEVLPLAVSLTQPSPATGWRNLECASFLERARGAFDAVLMLAVIHHLLVTERVPLPLVFDLAAELTTDLLIAEFVPTDDPMFRRLARGRDDLFTHLTREYFEATCGEHFAVVESRRLDDSGRWIYLLRKKGSTTADV